MLGSSKVLILLKRRKIQLENEANEYHVTEIENLIESCQSFHIVWSYRGLYLIKYCPSSVRMFIIIKC